MRVGDENLPDTINLYEILGLQATNKPDTSLIKKAYKKLVLLHHPDHGGETERFILINKAYRVLSDPSLRRQYDNLRKGVNHETFGKEQSQTTKSIIEELKWIEQLIKKAWDFYNEFQRMQTTNQAIKNFGPYVTNKYKHPLEPIIPIDVQGEAIATESAVSTINPKVNTTTKQSLDIEISATLRQYMLKRWKKVKMHLPPSTREHILKIPLFVPIQTIVSGNRTINIRLKIENYVDESTGVTWSHHSDKILITSRPTIGWREPPDSLSGPEPLARGSCTEGTGPPTIGWREPRDSLSCRNVVSKGPDGIEYSFEIETVSLGEAVSPLNIYYSENYRFIVCLLNANEEKGKVDEIENSTKIITKIILKPFKSIEDLVSVLNSNP